MPNFITTLKRLIEWYPPQYRMIGCQCNEGDTTLQWLWVIKGRDKRCGCGYWFRIKEHAPIDLYDMPA